MAISLVLSSYTLFAQHSFDSSYFESFESKITSRFYLSQKYTVLRLRGTGQIPSLEYRPNTSLNMGVGATYGWFTLNIALPFAFLNRNEDIKGKTKYLDLQSTFYSRKLSVDLLGQFYRGYYLYPKGKGTTGDNYYVRPDLRQVHIGISYYYILNWRRFSFRATMLQNEWQKRSAGSFLLGGDFYYGGSRGDSALVPAALSGEYTQRDIDRVRYIAIGPGVGYAYTLVVLRHFYATAAATVSASFSSSWEHRVDDSKHGRFSLSPNLFYHAGIGYNSEKIAISALWVNNSANVYADAGDYKIATGKVRLLFTYRLDPGPKLRHRIRFFAPENRLLK